MPDWPESVLITAGPTHEPLDEVRYLGNRSSGRMGLALAGAAYARGLATTLLLGPVQFDPSLLDTHGTVLRFQTAADLQALLREQWPTHDLLMMAAAVADYRPAHRAVGEKWRREAERITIELRRTPDLVAEAAASRRSDQRIIAFALEPSGRLAGSAADKMLRKGVDAIVANPLHTIAAETIEAYLLLPDGRRLTPHRAEAPVTKQAFAAWLFEAVSSHLRPDVERHVIRTDDS